MARNWWLLQKHGLISFLMVATWPPFEPDPFAMFFFTPQFWWASTSGLIAYVIITFLPHSGPVSEFLIALRITWGAPRQRVEEAPKPPAQAAQAAQAAAAATPDQADGDTWIRNQSCWDELPDFELFLRLNMKNVGSTKIFDLFSLVGFRKMLPFMASLQSRMPF